MFERTVNTPIITPVTFDPMSVCLRSTETIIDVTGVTVHTTQMDSGDWYVCATETSDPASEPLQPGMMFSTELAARIFETYLIHELRHIAEHADGYALSDITRRYSTPDPTTVERCIHVAWICTEDGNPDATAECSDGLDSCCGCCKLGGRR